MGKFFNAVVMRQKKIPNIHNRGDKSLESLRGEFNEIVRQSQEPSLGEKRLANLEKAREAKKRKRELQNEKS